MPESATIPETAQDKTAAQAPKPNSTPTQSVDAVKSVVAAVQRCCAAYQQALVAAGGPQARGARDAAEGAFRKNLPWVVDRDSIRAFVACITQGMVLGIFWREDGIRLMTAARAALATQPALSPQRGTSRGPGRPSKETF
jgi:hypothetical protein